MSSVSILLNSVKAVALITVLKITEKTNLLEHTTEIIAMILFPHSITTADLVFNIKCVQVDDIH